MDKERNRSREGGKYGWLEKRIKNKCRKGGRRTLEHGVM